QGKKSHTGSLKLYIRPLYPLEERNSTPSRREHGKSAVNTGQDMGKTLSTSEPFKRLGGYLEGQFLIASPQLQDPFFQHTVVYVCLHNAEGAMGVIINRTMPSLPFKKIARQLDITLNKGSVTPVIHFGGPVNPQQGFVLH